MSSLAALVLMAASPASEAPPAGLSAREAMANYHAVIHAATAPDTPERCPEASGDGIVVCGRSHHAPPRLPLPDERADAGEAVHHPGEPSSNKSLAPEGPHCRMACEPSHLGETLGKGIGLLRSLFTGEDPDD
jgi:hypothetical protein